jgi:hypothetical protein
MDALKAFTPIQQKIEAYNRDLPHRTQEWLLVSAVDDLISIDFYGIPWHDPFHELLALLSDAAIASRLHRLFFHAPDVGANGTKHWDFSPLLAAPVEFPNLRHLAIELYDGSGHNRPIVAGAYDYEEQGMLARWLDKAQGLTYLAAPSAPNAAFFERRGHPLERLNLQAGYDTQNFVQHFAQSDAFPELTRIDYQDYNERYMDDFPVGCTPFEDFRALFQSPAFDPVKLFCWHNPIFTLDELMSLKALRRDLLVRVIRTDSDYVR